MTCKCASSCRVTSSDINAHEYRFGSALQGASCGDYETLVQMPSRGVLGRMAQVYWATGKVLWTRTKRNRGALYNSRLTIFPSILCHKQRRLQTRIRSISIYHFVAAFSELRFKFGLPESAQEVRKLCLIKGERIGNDIPDYEPWQAASCIS